jgi:hypothetical protein
MGREITMLTPIAGMLKELHNLTEDCLIDLKQNNLDNLNCNLDEMEDILALVRNLINEVEEGG